MPAATGYYLPGDSWLHRRNPLTKLLALGWVLLAAFLLPPMGSADPHCRCRVGCLVGRDPPNLVRAMRIPAVLLLSILVVNAFLFPGATDEIVGFGPFAITREGLTFGLISAGRVLVAFLASVTFLLTTLADDLLESLIARGASHRIAFVVLSAVQMVPRLQARAGSILEAQQARGLPVTGSFGDAHPRARAAVGPVAARVADRRSRADVRARGPRLRRTSRPHGVSDRGRSASGPRGAASR